ncbi:hypothetical protein [Catenulispora pinisilvae]|uniref:hypothetical protein n=1 Tax=Catenulispora pinisilvae TaxID=2705253 RepID=UPI0018927853|nr:hypothetical protein [Catenulispora pinisilvae]
MSDHTPAGTYPIVINVTDLDLNTVIDHEFAGYNEDGDPVDGPPRTLADAVADRIAERLVAQHFNRFDMTRIRDELIRSKLEPVVQTALHTPRGVGIGAERSFADQVADIVARQIELFDKRDTTSYRPTWASPLRREVEDIVTTQMQKHASGVRGLVDAAIRNDIAAQFATRLTAAVDDAASTFRHAVLDATKTPAQR